jgi:hypothetical protein
MSFKASKKSDGPVMDEVLKRKTRYWDSKQFEYKPDQFENYSLILQQGQIYPS